MHDSWPYRREIAHFADDFERRQQRQIWRDASMAKAERMLFVGFLYVRKLIESRKVTDACARASVTISRSSIVRDYEVSDFKRDDIEKDLPHAAWIESKVDVHQLADKVLHAWWLIPVQGKSAGLEAFILTTDRQRNTELWRLPTSSIVAVYRQFANGSINRQEAARDDVGRLTYWSAT
jgi:hypothetical protein